MREWLARGLGLHYLSYPLRCRNRPLPRRPAHAALNCY